MEAEWEGMRFQVARQLKLPLLAAVLAECGRYVGHDSGVSHIAAAVGARCVLLFGPTDPLLWAPLNRGVTVLRAPEGEWARLGMLTVWDGIRGLWEEGWA